MDIHHMSSNLGTGIDATTKEDGDVTTPTRGR